MKALRPARILVVDDDRNVRELVLDVLADAGHHAAGAADGAAALDRIGREPADLVLLDLDLPGASGAEILPRIRDREAPPAVVVLTADRRTESVVALMRAGADDYVVKPVDEEGLLFRIEQVLASRRLREEVDRLRHPGAVDGGRHGIVGGSARLQAVLARIALVAGTEVPVLITGESGTGKELAARAIHGESGRAGGPFVAANAASLPGGLLEDALFGHVRGAFTGALRDARGLFEEARGGTLFLDEIGEASPDVQVKLLRAVESRAVRPIGAEREVPTDIRLLVATNRNLEAEVAAGRFRPDLYYRLSVFPIALPPLRDRVEDIGALATYFARRFCAELGRGDPGISPEATELLTRHDWPGNVRQLQNVVKQAVILAAGGLVLPEHLAIPRVTDAPASDPGPIPPFHEAKAGFEREYLERLLSACGGNVVKAAQVSGIDRKEIYTRVKRHELDLDSYRARLTTPESA